MEFIPWRPEYSVGVATIDEQHRVLVAHINRLHDAMRAGRGKDVLEDTLAGLAAYAIFHFGTEEALMARAAFPAAPAHRAEHAAFAVRVAGFQGRFADGTACLAVPVTDFLASWLRDHILRVDRGLGRHLAGRAAAPVP